MSAGATPQDGESGRRVSYSQYSIWANCPKQWKLAYHDKLKPDDKSIHLIFGTAIHEAIQHWLDLLFNGAKYKAKIFDIEDFFRETLFNLFTEEIAVGADGTKTFLCNRATLQEFYLDGIEILRHVRKYQKEFFPTAGYELVGCEIPLEMMVAPSVQFIGYVDIIIRNKVTGSVTIYDLKTSKRGWFYERKDPKKLNQLLLYKKFYGEQFGVPQDKITVRFLILKRKIDENSQWENAKKRLSNFEPSQGAPSVKKATESFDTFVSTTFDQDGKVMVQNLSATPSESACKWCPFSENRELCPESYKLRRK